MAEQEITEQKPTKEQQESLEKQTSKKKIGKRLNKIPKGLLFSPGGMILLFSAIIIEISDFIIPPFGADSLIIELIPEIFFAFLLKIITGIPLSANIIPFIIERFDILGILPTWLIRLFL